MNTESTQGSDGGWKFTVDDLDEDMPQPEVGSEARALAVRPAGALEQRPSRRPSPHRIPSVPPPPQ